ncbi:hypothetical protein BDDG_02374 [Blastomyces dermatitidis ATCC 18188]|uniref:Uncharacterized protein n=1 Tax=Ajellomyces dermatitidis (strain ATCC 18188 / CBS 674.68) TaxID=653446 RepID=F2T872_AJEDA|nr:hypothetical protein BDDG_02374 [Blastomyces dermatitidis ATCC 18188]EQL28500.1 hypothetical protein BDFG_08765 [Blastomyces dermatitidis ATCC 26199]
MDDNKDINKLHDDEEPKIEEAKDGVKTTPKNMALLSSSADAAKKKRNENRDNAAKTALRRYCQGRFGRDRAVEWGHRFEE